MARRVNNYIDGGDDGGNSGLDREFVARRLRRARTAAGMTQAEAGRRTGVSPATIYWHETRENLPRRITLAALARVYGRSMDWFTDEHLAISGPRWHGGLDPCPGPGVDIEVVGGPLVAGVAGAGSLALDETPIDWYPMRQDKLVAGGTNARHCRLVEVRGDSVVPRCPSGSLVLVDTSRRRLEDGTIYLMTDPADGLVVRMAPQDGLRWVVVPDHPGWRPRNYTDSWQVLGRVLSCQTRLG